MMKTVKHILFGFLIVTSTGLTSGQVSADSDLFETLRKKDSTLFHAAFNACDPDTMASLFTADFEFYHDKGGPTTGRDAFLSPVYSQCDELSENWKQPSRRILLPKTLTVYPLRNNGELYGAIQQGMHRFEFLNEKQEYQKGDIARFVHLWILEEGQWKIKRELSYDHQPAESYQIE